MNIGNLEEYKPRVEVLRNPRVSGVPSTARLGASSLSLFAPFVFNKHDEAMQPRTVIMRILYLLPSLNYNGAAKQALLLSRGLAKTCDIHVCALQDDGPWVASFREAGAAVHSLNWVRPLDPLPLWRLHRLVAELKPDCIHVWRLPALRSLALTARKLLSRCIVSQALPTDRLQPQLGRWDRWLLQRVAKIVAGGAGERDCLERLGFARERIAVVPPGVDISQENSETNSRRIVCLGNLADHKGFRDALRAADYLTYTFPDLQLHIIGSGPGLESLQRYRKAAFYRDHMHFLGAHADAQSRLACADICWVPSLTATGRQVALEAMAAARPVIASDLPHFREIIVDGVSGLLVPPGDKTALARRSRQLFLDDGLRRRLGEAASARVRDHFAAKTFIGNCRALYGAEPPCIFLQTAARDRFSIAAVETSRNNALVNNTISSDRNREGALRSGRHVS